MRPAASANSGPDRSTPGQQLAPLHLAVAHLAEQVGQPLQLVADLLEAGNERLKVFRLLRRRRVATRILCTDSGSPWRTPGVVLGEGVALLPGVQEDGVLVLGVGFAFGGGGEPAVQGAGDLGRARGRGSARAEQAALDRRQQARVAVDQLDLDLLPALRPAARLGDHRILRDQGERVALGVAQRRLHPVRAQAGDRLERLAPDDRPDLPGQLGRHLVAGAVQREAVLDAAAAAARGLEMPAGVVAARPPAQGPAVLHQGQLVGVEVGGVEIMGLGLGGASDARRARQRREHEALRDVVFTFSFAGDLHLFMLPDRAPQTQAIRLAASAQLGLSFNWHR